jgi:uncharacterized protein (DUF3084 family)
VNLLEVTGGHNEKAEETRETNLKKEEHKVEQELAKIEKQSGLTNAEVNRMVKEEKSANAQNKDGNNQAVNLLDCV